MQCPQCNAQLDEDTIFCGNCGKQIAPLQAKGATVTYKGESGDADATMHSGQVSSRPVLQTPVTPAQNSATLPSAPRRDNTPSTPSTPSPPTPSQPPSRQNNIR